jgi:hypothetical protein
VRGHESFLSRKSILTFGGGVLAGVIAAVTFGTLETRYWRNPGWFSAEVPRLHAWAVRLMELGGPGRDGFAEYLVPQSEWAARGGTLKECFATGGYTFMIQYSGEDDTLAGVYRCQIGSLVGELQLAFYGPQAPWESNGAYEFRTYDPAGAPPIEPIGLMGR